MGEIHSEPDDWDTDDDGPEPQPIQPTAKERKLGQQILKVVTDHKGTWDWRKDKTLTLTFPDGEARYQAALALETLHDEDDSLLWQIDEADNPIAMHLEFWNNGIEAVITRHFVPLVHEDFDFMEKLYQACVSRGRWDKWEHEYRIKLKFKDKGERDTAAKTLNELLNGHPLEIATDPRATSGISNKSLAIIPATRDIGSWLWSYFRSRDREQFIEDRIAAQRRSAEQEMKVIRMLELLDVQAKPRIKVRGDKWDWLFNVAGKEVDMFTAFSATTSDTDMEERYAALKREEPHRRSIELDVTALIGTAALVGELKTLPEKDSVWAWYAHGYASAIHKFVLKSGNARRQAFEQQPSHIIPVMIVNRDPTPEEMKERKISPALIAALNLPGMKGTPKDIASHGLEGVITHIDAVARDHVRYGDREDDPASLEEHRQAALTQAHFSQRFATPILTVEDVEQLVQQVKAQAPVGQTAYSVNGKRVAAYPVPAYAGSTVLRTPWLERQLPVSSVLKLAKTLLTEEGQAYALYYAWKNHLTMQTKNDGQMRLFPEQSLEDLVLQAALKPGSPIRYDVVEALHKREAYETLITAGLYVDAFMVAFDNQQGEAAYALVAKTAELMRKDGKTGLAASIEAVLAKHARDLPNLGIEFCKTMGDPRTAETIAHRNDWRDPKLILGKDHLDRMDFYQLQKTMKQEEFAKLVQEQLKEYEARGWWRKAAECLEYLEGKDVRRKELRYLLESQGRPETDIRIRLAAFDLLGLNERDYDAEQLTPLTESKNVGDWEIAAIVLFNNGYYFSDERTAQVKQLWRKVIEHCEADGTHGMIFHAAWIAKERLHDKRKYVELLKRAGEEKALIEHYEEEGKLDKVIAYHEERHHDRELPWLYERTGQLEKALDGFAKLELTRKVVPLAYKLGRQDVLEREIAVLKTRLSFCGRGGKAYAAILEEMFGDPLKAIAAYEEAGMHQAVLEIALEQGNLEKAKASFEPALRENEEVGHFATCAYLCRRMGDEDRARVYQTFVASFKEHVKRDELREKFRVGIEDLRAKAAQYRTQGDLEKAKEYDDLVKTNEGIAARNEEIFSERIKRKGQPLEPEDEEGDDEE